MKAVLCFSTLHRITMEEHDGFEDEEVEEDENITSRLRMKDYRVQT